MHAPRCAIGATGPGAARWRRHVGSTVGGVIAPAAGQLVTATPMAPSRPQIPVRHVAASPIQHPGEQTDQVGQHRDQRGVESRGQESASRRIGSE